MNRIDTNQLLDILLEIPVFSHQVNRTMLLEDLPSVPVGAIPRHSSPMADLYSIISTAKAWGRLESGRWAITSVINNALRFVRGLPQHEKALRDILAKFETSTANEPLFPIENEEIVIGQDERLPIAFLEKALHVSRSVAKLIVPRIIDGVPESGNVSGSGWLIAPNLLLTNHHVIDARDRRTEPAATKADFQLQATGAIAWFGYDTEDSEHTDYACTELIKANRKLDYALLRLSSTPIAGSHVNISQWGYLPIPRTQPILYKGNRLNIIQHPRGEPKRFALRSNFYVDELSTADAPDRIRYLTDTEPGASGSPVFNDDWYVVALHHASVERQASVQYKDAVTSYNNQGILIHSIIKDFPDNIRRVVEVAQNWG